MAATEPATISQTRPSNTRDATRRHRARDMTVGVETVLA